MITVEIEPEEFHKEPAENCFKCGYATRYWYQGGEVACCPILKPIDNLLKTPYHFKYEQTTYRI